MSAVEFKSGLKTLNPKVSSGAAKIWSVVEEKKSLLFAEHVIQSPL